MFRESPRQSFVFTPTVLFQRMDLDAQVDFKIGFISALRQYFGPELESGRTDVALTRKKHPDAGIVCPFTFLTGGTIGFDQWVFYLHDFVRPPIARTQNFV